MRTIGSLFSGIGGLELGLERAGCGEVAWQVEIDPTCQRVLAKHWPLVTRYSDVRTVGANNLTPVWLICGGFPCQDVSSAGKQAGVRDGTRSGLWFEYRRIVGELRPEWVVVENVASGKKLWLPQVRRDLHLLGYDSVAFGLSARDVGASHLRRRVFVVALNGQEEHVAHTHGEAQRAVSEHAQVGRQQATATGSWNGWESIPPFRGVDDGLSGGLDARLKQLGNAVVPQCAEAIGKLIMDIQ